MTRSKGKEDGAASFEGTPAELLDVSRADHILSAHCQTERAFVVDKHNRTTTAHFLLFEYLQDNFDDRVEELGLGDRTLPWRGKAALAPDHHDRFSSAAQAMVECKFGEHLEHFGYTL
ncbi:hypothetical protein IP79_10345 [Porphyrobacter sp. AAP60]|nr:hypothetical protein IP79_10345 [Porphyrobacter sp. AAP60]